MYRIYFKQGWQMLRQNRFMSVVSIVGTALAIMMIMVLLVTDGIKNISVAPEVNRDHTYYITHQIEQSGGDNYWSGYLHYETITQYLSELKVPDITSAYSIIENYLPPIISNESMQDILEGIVRYTDSNYWKILSFSFIEGSPFSQEAFESSVNEAVISESIAKVLFKGEKVLGETIMIDFIPYRVTGVVKDISPVFRESYGDIWVPYTTKESLKDSRVFQVMMLLKNKEDYPALVDEIRKAEKRYSQENPPFTLWLRTPEDHITHSLNIEAYGEESVQSNIRIQKRKRIFILSILLLIPAVNLSSLSLSRIKKRREEIGVRKAFGAKKRVLILQVLCENMITSLIGGGIGFLLSYPVIFQMRKWLLDIPADQMIPVNTLISFPILISIVLVCIIINLLSAGLPAYRATKMSIIHSLTQNDK